jgi:hypothetical protein
LSWTGSWRYPPKPDYLGFTQDDAYGRRISRVIDFPNSCGWTGVVQRFAPLWEGFGTDITWTPPTPAQLKPGFLFELGRLAITLEKLACWRGLETLLRWPEAHMRRFVLLCALQLVFDEQNWYAGFPAHMVHSIRSSGKRYMARMFREDFNIQEGYPPNMDDPQGIFTEEFLPDILKKVMCELCMSLHLGNLAIGELRDETRYRRLHNTYVIGHSAIQPGMLLIPLHTIDSAGQSWLESPLSHGCDHVWANAMVVRPLEQDTMLDSVHNDFVCGKGGSIQPNRAYYITFCSLPLFEHLDMAIGGEKKVERIYLDAEQNGLPPPFTIDLM